MDRITLFRSKECYVGLTVIYIIIHRSGWMWGIFLKILSNLQNIIMDLNNVMRNGFNMKRLISTWWSYYKIDLRLSSIYILKSGRRLISSELVWMTLRADLFLIFFSHPCMYGRDIIMVLEGVVELRTRPLDVLICFARFMLPLPPFGCSSQYWLCIFDCGSTIGVCR